MMRRLFKIWTVALVCSAMMAMLSPHVVAQTASEGNRHQEMTIYLVLLSNCSIVGSNASEKSEETMCILRIRFDCAGAEQRTDAQSGMAHHKKNLFWPLNLKPMVLEEVSVSVRAGRKIMEGARLIPIGMPLLMMKDEKAWSSAEKIITEGHGTLERDQKTVMTLRL